jgi:hypothetical protein
MLRSVVSNSIRRTNVTTNGLLLGRGGRTAGRLPPCHYDKALGYHCASSFGSQTNQNASTISSNDKRLTWQAEHNVDIQRVTQRAIVSYIVDVCLSVCLLNIYIYRLIFMDDDSTYYVPRLPR